MCSISNKIKFCTCTNDRAVKTGNYWMLFRGDLNGRLMYVGESVLPTSILDLNFELNRETLLNRLSENDAFDTPIEFKERDVLMITVNADWKESKNVTYEYFFEYLRGQWESTEYDQLDLLNKLEEYKFGKVESALKDPD